MSWIKLNMKYPGTCMACGEKIGIGEPGLWQKDVGVKHEKCAGAAELKCIVCGGPAGCPSCEFQDECDLEAVSQLCICTKCGQKDAFLKYRESVGKRFSLLNIGP